LEAKENPLLPFQKKEEKEMAPAKSDSTKKEAKAKTTTRSRGQSTAKPRQSRKPRNSRPLTQKVLDEKTGAILMESVLSQLSEPQEFGRQLGKGIALGVAEEANHNNDNHKESTMDPNTINAGDTITPEQAQTIADLSKRPTVMNKYVTVTLTALATLGLGVFVGSRGKKRLRAENAAFRSGDMTPMAANG